MVQSEFLLQRLSPFTNQKKLLVEYQSTNDIIKSLCDAHEKYKQEYDKIAKYFWQGNVKSTCNYIWKFLKHNVYYDIEPDNRQTVKSPSAILSTGRFRSGKNDCKHYSSFFGGVLSALQRQGIKINWCYRFANYKLFETTPHHVFVVVKHNGNEIWCDAVLSGFNYQKPYINKIDKKMALYSISGVGCNKCYEQSGGFGEVSLGKTKQQKKQSRRAGINCKGRTVAKASLSVPRNAFLTLVRLNFKKFAVKLHNRMQNPATKLQIMEKWCKMGGDARKLESAVEKAYQKYKRKQLNRVSGIGTPVAVTIISTATPLLIAMAKFLKPERADEIEETGEAIQQSIENYQSSTSANEDNDQSVSGFDTKTLLMYGGIGFVMYYLYKKAI